MKFLQDITVNNDVTAVGVVSASRFTSTVATGTAPLTVASVTVVPNLNADLLDGQHASYFLNTSSTDQTKPATLTVHRLYVSGADSGMIITRRDTFAAAWQWYSSAGSLQLYDHVNTVDRITFTAAGAMTINGTVSATSFSGPLTGNVTGNASSATYASNVTVAAAAGATNYLAMYTAASGNIPTYVSSSCVWNATSSTLTVPNLTVSTTLTATVSNATNATNATNIGITNDAATNATMYPVWVTANTGNLPAKVTSTKLTFNPSTGTLTATAFSGPLTGNVNGNVTGSSGSCSGNAASATYASNVTVAAAAGTTNYLGMYTATTGNIASYASASCTWNATSSTLTVPNLTVTTTLTANASSATNAANIGITDDTATSAAMYPVWVTASTGNLPAKVSSTKFTFNPASGHIDCNGIVTSWHDVSIGAGSYTVNVTSNMSHNSLYTNNRGGKAIEFTHATSNWVQWGTGGVAAPTFNTSSAGTKLLLYPGVGASAVDFAIGIESGTQWFSVPVTTNAFKWYGATTTMMQLSNSVLSVGGNTVLHAGNYNTYAPTLTGTGASGSWGISITGSSASCTGNAASATNIGVTDDTATNATMYPVWVTTTTGNLPARVTSTKLTYNPSTGVLSTTRLTSTVSTGTAPFSVTSTTVVTNLNADLLDGQQGSYYQDASNLNAGTVANARLSGAYTGITGIGDRITNLTSGPRVTLPAGSIGTGSPGNLGLEVYQATAGSDAYLTFHVAGDWAGHFGMDGATNDFFIGGWSYGAVKHKVWHAGNDGASSTLDADLLDGQHGSYYLDTSGTSQTKTGEITFRNGTNGLALHIGPSDTGGTGNGGGVNFYTGGGKYWHLVSRADAHADTTLERNWLKLFYYDGSTWTTSTTFRPNGNVGIGANADGTDKLSVSGNIRMDGWLTSVSSGAGAPTFTTRSNGTKLIINAALAGAAVDYAMGLEANHFWFSTATTGTGFKWYGGTTNWGTLNSSGLTLTNGLSATSATISGTISSTGAGAAVYVANRGNGAQSWAMYSPDGTLSFWFHNGTTGADVTTITTAGLLTTASASFTDCTVTGKLNLPTSQPGSPVNGSCYWDGATNKFWVYSSTYGWKSVTLT